MLNRDQFCKLTGLKSINAMKSRARRQQLPVAAEAEARKAYGYSWLDVLITLVSEKNASEPLYMSPVAAASVARLLAPAFVDAWIDIVASAEQLNCGALKGAEIEWLILYGVAFDPPRCIVGTASEIAAQRGPQPVVTQIGGSATRAASVMLIRAANHDIAIPDDFWTTKPSLVAGELEPKSQALDEAGERVNVKTSKRK